VLCGGHCVYIGSDALALEGHSAQGVGGNTVFERALRTLIDQDAASRHLGVRLQTRRQVNFFANTGVRGALLCTGLASHDIATGDTNSDADFRLLNSAAFLVELLDQLDHFKCCSDRVAGAVV
jgi:hypothetical protein